MQWFYDFVGWANGWLWGIGMLVIIGGTGIIFRERRLDHRPRRDAHCRGAVLMDRQEHPAAGGGGGHQADIDF